MKFYIIKKSFVGPTDEHIEPINLTTIDISTIPAKTNQGHEDKINGWCGTTDDWSVDAHGEHETLSAAEDAVKQIFGEVRDEPANESEEDDFYVTEIVVKKYKLRKYPTLTPAEAGDYLYESIDEHITIETTEEEKNRLVAVWQSEAEEEGYILLASSVMSIIDEYQDSLSGE